MSAASTVDAATRRWQRPARPRDGWPTRFRACTVRGAAHACHRRPCCVQVNGAVARPLPQTLRFVLCLRVPAHDFGDDVPTLPMCRRDPGGRTTGARRAPPRGVPIARQLTHRVRETFQPGLSPPSRQAVGEALRDPQRGHATMLSERPSRRLHDGAAVEDRGSVVRPGDSRPGEVSASRCRSAAAPGSTQERPPRCRAVRPQAGPRHVERGSARGSRRRRLRRSRWRRRAGHRRLELQRCADERAARRRSQSDPPYLRRPAVLHPGKVGPERQADRDDGDPLHLVVREHDQRELAESRRLESVPWWPTVVGHTATTDGLAPVQLVKPDQHGTDPGRPRS